MKSSHLLVLVAVAAATAAPIASGHSPFSDRTSRGNFRPNTSRRLAKGSKNGSNRWYRLPAPQPSSPSALASVFPPRSPARAPSPPAAPLFYYASSKSGKSSKSSKSSKSGHYATSSSTSHNIYLASAKSGKSSKSAKALGGSKSGKVGKSSYVYRPAVVVMTDPPTPLPTPPPTKKDRSFRPPSPSPTTLQQAWIKTFNVEEENTNPCIGPPCPNTAHCRSQFDTCGPGMMYCNSASIWTNSCPTPTPAPTPLPTRRPVVTPEPTYNMLTIRAFSTPEPTEDTRLSQSAPMFAEDFLEVSDELTAPNEATEEDEKRLPPPSVKETQPDSSSGLPIGAWIGIAVAVAVAAMAGVAAGLYRRKLSMQNELSSPVDETGVDIVDDLIGTPVGEGAAAEPAGAAV